MAAAGGGCGAVHAIRIQRAARIGLSEGLQR
jgi:hypothetical protein